MLNFNKQNNFKSRKPTQMTMNEYDAMRSFSRLLVEKEVIPGMRLKNNDGNIETGEDGRRTQSLKRFHTPNIPIPIPGQTTVNKSFKLPSYASCLQASIRPKTFQQLKFYLELAVKDKKVADIAYKTLSYNEGEEKQPRGMLWTAQGTSSGLDYAN